jgi:hypothetical protein
VSTHDPSLHRTADIGNWPKDCGLSPKADDLRVSALSRMFKHADPVPQRTLFTLPDYPRCGVTHCDRKSMPSRRTLLLLLLALLSFDFGVSQYGMKHDTPAGWKTERWQAGFGSWCCGGYLVAYDISIPSDYYFAQKCGNAWVVNDDAMVDDFLIELSFFGTSSSQYGDKDFDDYLRSGAVRSADSFGRHVSEIDVDSARPYEAI